jgi:VWFA-related protein
MFMRASLRRIELRSALILIALAGAVRPGDAAAQVSTPATTASQPTPADSPPQNLWLIFLDDLHIDFMTSGHLRTLLKTICSELIQEGDVAGSVSTGPASIALDLTSDRQRVSAGLGRAIGSSLRPTDMRASQADPRGPSEGSYRTEVWYRAAVSIATAYDTLENFGRQPARRKTVIYVSSGYGVDPLPDRSPTVIGTKPGVTSGNNISAAEVREQLSELIAQARRSNVTVFAIDSRRLGGSSTAAPGGDSVWWQNYWATTRNSLRALSERTGGFAVLEEQDLADGLKRINASMRK